MVVNITSQDCYELAEQIDTFVSKSDDWYRELDTNPNVIRHKIEVILEHTRYLYDTWIAISEQLKQIDSALSSLFIGNENNSEKHHKISMQIRRFLSDRTYIYDMIKDFNQILDCYVSVVDMMGFPMEFPYEPNFEKALCKWQQLFCEMWPNVINHSYEVSDALKMTAGLLYEAETHMSILYASPTRLSPFRFLSE